MGRPSRIAGFFAIAACAVASVSCPSTSQIPGTQLATFRFTVKVADAGSTCLAAGYTELPTANVNFEFDAVFSGELDGSVRWMTLGDQTRDASFDGQSISAPFSASPRTFALCVNDAGVVEQSRVDETFDVALLSKSQTFDLTNDQNPSSETVCIALADAGGTPPFNPSGGVTRPGMSPTGFDAVSACGVLGNTIQPNTSTTSCVPCSMTFVVTGTRLQ